MRRIRIHVEGPLVSGGRAALSESASQHLGRVLRLQAGDEIQAFDGEGGEWRARIAELAKRGGEIELLDALPALPEPALRIELGQALARGEKMDLVLQKATELGAVRIAPLVTERSEVKLDAERAERRLAHWRGVLIGACEQCGRARLPQLSAPQKLEDWAAQVQAPIRLLLDPEGERNLADIAAAIPQGGAELALAIGPEGGFGPRDLAALRAGGFLGLRLGPRVLRTETAGLAALAALQAVAGDLR
jgi:16S rRNA (uracil1498-N3)-methyltransferase